MRTQPNIGIETPTSGEVSAFLQSYQNNAPDWAMEYLKIHKKRFQITIESLPKGNCRQSAIELGTYGLFLMALRELGGYGHVDGTVFDQSQPEKVFHQQFPFDPVKHSYQCYNMDLERECVPVGPSFYDFVLCCETLEHLATDPMALVYEMNRILRPGGIVLLTTPNIGCLWNIHRILQGEIPNNYHVYRRARNHDRHNLEYTPSLLSKIFAAGGFETVRLWTENCWTPVPPQPLIEFMEREGYPLDLRGDDIFIIARKIKAGQDRLPSFLYG